MRMQGRVLAIAGSDSGGGAGIQADIKTITALGAYASTAITALTAQDTLGVHAVHPVPADFLRLQISLALADPGADVVKTGMLVDAVTMTVVCDALAGAWPVVVDPVMTAKGGRALLASEALAVLRERLIPRAALLTPNLPEAGLILGREVVTEADMHRAADRLLGLGAAAVLLKGGHMAGNLLVDLLATPGGTIRFEQTRIATSHTHGTGCTLASAVAAGLAQGMTLEAAVRRARDFVRAAIAAAPAIGRGHGPLNHAVWG